MTTEEGRDPVEDFRWSREVTQETPQVPRLDQQPPVWFQVLAAIGMLAWCCATPAVLIMLAADKVGLW